jgi:hypothetical protein
MFGARVIAKAGVLLLVAGCATPATAPSDSPAVQTGSPVATVSPNPTAQPTPTPLATPSPEPSGSPLVYQSIPMEPTGPEVTGSPLRAEDTEGSFVLSMEATQDRYRAGQLIEIVAKLSYTGDKAEVVALGSGNSLVVFALEGGDPPVRIDPAFTTDCAPHRLTPAKPLVFPFGKSGSSSPDDPDYAFRQAYFSDQKLRLPAGTWTIRASSGFYVGSDCGEGGLHSLEAEVTFTVLP